MSDRIVEPYRFMNSNDDIRCYEPASGQNKTFKISRIGEVKLLDIKWISEPAHEQIYTDAFGFTGTPINTIKLRLSERAASLMEEELPRSRRFITHADNNTYTFEDRTCSYLGATRFVLGLYNDIEIIESAKFKEFIRKNIKDLTHKFEY